MAGKKDAKAPAIDKLRHAINVQHKIEDVSEYRQRRPRRDDFTLKQQKAYLDTFSAGGANEYLLEEAKLHKTHRERVFWIAELMASGRYRTHLQLVLSKVWGLTPAAVRRNAMEASQIVDSAFGDRDQLRATAMAFLETVAQDALQNGDRRSAVTAVRTFAEISGILTHRMETANGSFTVNHTHTHILAKMSDEELDKLLAEQTAEAVRTGRLDLGTVTKMLTAPADVPDAELVEVGEDDEEEDE